MATSHSNSHLTCGITHLDHLLSHWLSMKLELNTFLSKMQIISSKLSRQILNHHRLVRWLVPRTQHQLALCGDLNAWLRAQSTSKVKTCPSWSPTTCTACIDSSSVWTENSIFQEDHLPFHDKAEATRVQAISGTTLQSYLLLMKFQIGNPNPQKNSQSLQTTDGLLVCPFLSSHPVLCKQYDTFPHIRCCLSGPPWSQKSLCYAIHSPQCSLFQTTIQLSMYWSRPLVVFLLQPLRQRLVVSSLVPKRLSPYSTHWLS